MAVLISQPIYCYDTPITSADRFSRIVKQSAYTYALLRPELKRQKRLSQKTGLPEIFIDAILEKKEHEKERHVYLLKKCIRKNTSQYIHYLKKRGNACDFNIFIVIILYSSFIWILLDIFCVGIHEKVDNIFSTYYFKGNYFTLDKIFYVFIFLEKLSHVNSTICEEIQLLRYSQYIETIC